MSNNGRMGAVDLLERPMYAMSQVDRLLDLYSGTARRWIDGYTRGSRHYEPIVREQSTDDDVVTWGEFVETRLLAGYRNSGIPIVRMRLTVRRLREEFGSYPLARAKLYFDGQELVYRVQAEVGLEEELQIVVAARSGQLVLSQSAKEFTEAVDWDGNVVRRLHPRGKGSPVVVDPLIAFGNPAVRGVRTEVLAEQHRAGDPVWFLADIYELPEEHIRAALDYEEVAA